ncbi:MAG: hypothetical protein JWP81_3593 [Ferruginibacter sp.]|nr:hypothetical protein [Ferruginibacter sp.]
MNIKEIISSGLLELYATGTTSEQERKDVEQWIAQYPEVASEVKEISTGLEAYARVYSIAPAAGIKEKIFAHINATENGRTAIITPITNAGAKIIDRTTFWKMAAAACLLLLLGSIALNIFTYSRYSRANGDLLIARQTLGTIEEQNKIMEEGMSVVQNKYSVPVALKGLEASPDAAAKVFWMQNTGEVFIDASNLPDAPQGKQYQLWAIVDGKPIDGGMIVTSTKGDKYRIQKMKTFGKVEAFAVTLEKEKGNPTPQGPMFVKGEI